VYKPTASGASSVLADQLRLEQVGSRSCEVVRIDSMRQRWPLFVSDLGLYLHPCSCRLDLQKLADGTLPQDHVVMGGESGHVIMMPEA
jgi:hypothetical protein